MSSTAPLGQRLVGWTAPEGRVSRMLLTILQHFEASVLFILSLSPALAFHALVGWQATHLAVWMGVAALLPAGPALYALLAVSDDFLLEGAYPGRGVRRFARAYRDGARGLAGWWALAAFLSLMLAYNLALSGGSDVAFFGVFTLFAGLLATTIGACCALRQGNSSGLLGLLWVIAGAAVRRPHVVLVQIFVVVATGLATMLPVIGPTLALFLPGLAATGLIVVHAMTGYARSLTQEIGPPDAR